MITNAPHVRAPETQTASLARRTISSKAPPATLSARQINTLTPQALRAQIAHKTARLAPRPLNAPSVHQVINS